MKYVDEFRDPALVAQLVKRIDASAARLPSRQQPWQLMEVCGGHTHAIFRFGLDRLLPDCVEFVHGPGCPVCVLPETVIDQAVALAQRPGTLLCSYGDAVRVPGTGGSLLEARAGGAAVEVVYGPRDALELARRHPDKDIVFLAIGFETTAPATALALQAARREGIGNFRALCHLVLIEPPLRALLADPQLCLDGFIGPGHVSLVTGTRPFDFIPAQYRRPVVISGFEPVDLLQSVWMLLRQLEQGKACVELQYRRVATTSGNSAARAAMEEVFEPAPSTEWRGLGSLPHSGLQLAPEYRAFDAAALLEPRAATGAEPGDPRCGCAAVLSGRMKPPHCPLFGRECTPATPSGPLMVSSEGACAAWYQYRQESADDRR
ncbi:hydrogenase expression/formation protein [Marinobacterium nitratireducens]|uniref:Hydrogenase maturation factor n=1 Tax=Marinobacterium nitratireducens TaxID=518897 RepID=A0A917ZMV1_9GAMM|nr:hydrogenase formation protein HypD [Marinobacterium nitratireducens]GGO86910.1 hydrogenase expression/formation protein [Marinobacterium nitratireducens]